MKITTETIIDYWMKKINSDVRRWKYLKDGTNW